MRGIFLVSTYSWHGIEKGPLSSFPFLNGPRLMHNFFLSRGVGRRMRAEDVQLGLISDRRTSALVLLLLSCPRKKGAKSICSCASKRVTSSTATERCERCHCAQRRMPSSSDRPDADEDKQKLVLGFSPFSFSFSRASPPPYSLFYAGL